jgi:hypothetical protein
VEGGGWGNRGTCVRVKTEMKEGKREKEREEGTGSEKRKIHG